MAREQPALHFLYREIDRLSSRVDKNALRAKLIAMRTAPVSRLQDIPTPVLFIAGDEDVVFPPAAAAALAAVVPGAKLERVAEAGHSVYFERAALFNELAGSFLG
jgi:pimeloyl-ACP methyl ester carboxylesterase